MSVLSHNPPVPLDDRSVVKPVQIPREVLCCMPLMPTVSFSSLFFFFPFFFCFVFKCSIEQWA